MYLVISTSGLPTSLVTRKCPWCPYSTHTHTPGPHSSGPPTVPRGRHYPRMIPQKTSSPPGTSLNLQPSQPHSPVSKRPLSNSDNRGGVPERRETHLGGGLEPSRDEDGEDYLPLPSVEVTSEEISQGTMCSITKKFSFYGFSLQRRNRFTKYCTTSLDPAGFTLDTNGLRFSLGSCTVRYLHGRFVYLRRNRLLLL